MIFGRGLEWKRWSEVYESMVVVYVYKLGGVWMV